MELTQALIRVDTTNDNETAAAEVLVDYLERATGGVVETEIVCREPRRGNLVARLPGAAPGAPDLALVGHLDVVPADARDWTHPPFAAEIDDAGYLFGRGAVDMKNEVAARAVALAELARSGFRPSGDLLLIAVADEENGAADVGMHWLLGARPELRPAYAVNEGGGQRLELTDGRA
ncbi:MAG: M20/M25/M40 family metallo-hydrolase, partial [Nocardioides sp.]